MEETERIARKLDKMLNGDSIEEELAIKYLKRLRNMEMTLDILTKTGVGILINKIRKISSNSDVATLGKNIIKQWKKLVPDKTESGMKRSPDGASNGVASDDGNGPSDVKKSRTADKTEAGEFALQGSAARGYFPTTTPAVLDPVRLKAREMMQTALECKPIPSGAYESEFLAIRIESAIYDLFHNTEAKYKQRVRTRVMNLKDSNNPNLRLNVLMGHVNPEKLASMTSEEMASKEMKELRERYSKEAIEDHQMATTGGTETELLRCGKCKQNKCTYNQVQTRSADEPMTTFVYCNHCGHRWRFC